AGVGRTGTYIAVDVNLDQAKNEGLIDVHNFVQQMRTMRVNMVQTLEQYMFVYDVLLEALICGDTSITLDSYPDTLSELLQYEQSIGKTKLDEQYEVLKLVTNTMERDETTVALRPENIFKNRCKMIVPANRCRPYLMTRVEDYNDYVNASFLN
ncbi:receptor-type tyrosine-protein phosphatase mu-like, partial [Mizuhopecten yessoensis]